MAQVKRKYIDSHWLVFFFQGAIALIFGCITLFAADQTLADLTRIIGVSLLALAVVELANLIHRSFKRQGWLVSILVALFDLGFGIAILCLANQDPVWRISMLASYTLIRGIFEILLGFRTTVDPTDRFIWVLCGICGAIFGIVIFNSGHLKGVDFIRFFGTYLLILGVSSLIYGAHNRTQQLEAGGASRSATNKRTKTGKAA